MRVVDAAGAEVGLLVSTNLVAMSAGSDVVVTFLDGTNRTFWNAEPLYFYASANCSGAPMMQVELPRLGSVFNGNLYYPQGAATPQPYSSSRYGLGDCYDTGGVPAVAVLAPMATTAVTQLQAPFAVVR